MGLSVDDGWADVLTGDGIFRLTEVQLEGQERTSAAAVIRSVRASLGLDSGQLLERLRWLEEQLGGRKGE